MSKTETKTKIVVMQAFADGKQIQFRPSGTLGSWDDWQQSREPRWDWRHFQYRVKPEPPRTFYLNMYPDGSNGPLYVSKEAAARGRFNGARTIKLVEEQTDE